jgi:hypothetical protein
MFLKSVKTLHILHLISHIFLLCEFYVGVIINAKTVHVSKTVLYGLTTMKAIQIASRARCPSVTQGPDTRMSQ